jgi:hypothetical protein
METTPLKNILFWRRIVRQAQNDKQDESASSSTSASTSASASAPTPAQKEITETEPFTLLYITADEFIELINSGTLKSTLDIVRRDMNLRRNKERLEMAGTPGYSSVLLKGSQDQKRRVFILISGVDIMFRDLRKKANDRFKDAVMATRQTNGRPIEPFRATENVSGVDIDRIEQEMLWLQLEQDCFVLQTNDLDETSQAIIALTEQIGYKRYK